MKRILLLLSFVLCFVSAFSQVRWNQRYQDYIDKYNGIAIREMCTYGIPASITLAQGLLESGAGQSELARKGNNHFGIKCHGWQGAKTYHDDDETQECFRAYNSVLESYEDHSRFLAESSRYRRLFSLSRTDYKGWANGLKQCGYATSPTYAAKLIQIIEAYNLHRYDKMEYVDVPVEPVPQVSTVIPQSPSDGLHAIHIYNRNYYLYARRGDTFRSIANEVGISYRKLAKYNERNKNDELHEGDIIYLKKKRTRAEKRFRKQRHVVQPGESMYTISQLYGIRLKSLYKKNNLLPDYQIRVGHKLRVY